MIFFVSIFFSSTIFLTAGDSVLFDSLLVVLDAVAMVELIMGDSFDQLSRYKAISNASLFYGNGTLQYEADGNISGIQIEVVGDYNITKHFIPESWEFSYNKNLIL